MQIRRFVGINAADALAQVKSALGAEAVIISKREFSPGDRRSRQFTRPLTEITAAIDFDFSAPGPAQTPRFNCKLRNYREQAPVDFDHTQQPQEMRNAECGVRSVECGVLTDDDLQVPKPESRISKPETRNPKPGTRNPEPKTRNPKPEERPAAAALQLPDPATEILQRLAEQCLCPQLLNELRQAMLRLIGRPALDEDRDPREFDFEIFARKWLEQQYTCATPREHGTYHGEPFICALVGPTGVGKTTTLAKLAARRVLNGQRVGLISLDTYRIAAVDQLRVYSRLLRVPLEVAANEAEFRAAVSRLREMDAIFIDTSGHSQRRADQRASQLELLGTVNAQVTLVLSLTSKESVLNNILAAYADAQLSDLIFTKVDEALEFGSVMNIAHRCQKPVAFLTTGQQVPEDIKISNKNYISDLCLKQLASANF